jgi:hypothetical protein
MLKAVVLFTLFEVAVAGAQTLTYQPPPTFNHIVIIVQENRTPDDLFGAGAVGHVGACGAQNDFEPGVDIQFGGPNKAAGGAISCLTSLPNLSGGGASHAHIQTDKNGVLVGWVPQCDLNAQGICQMDGACHSDEYPNCPEYTYVTKSVVQPYYDIATNYGWANYMFATNQGPSYPAHQFLLGGTSAPVFPGDSHNYYQDFVAENASFLDSGCPEGSGPKWINPGGIELKDPIGSECYDRNTLVTYQDSAGVHDKLAALNPPQTWKYFAQTQGIIWDAPESVPQICYSAISGSGPCDVNGAEWNDHVILQPKENLSSAPILKEIKNCHLAAISWVTPDEAWSDHPGGGDQSLGPSWVANIVDAIGESTCTDPNGNTYWQDTAIFITWDDWGGFYDHVPPPVTYTGTLDPTTMQWTCTDQDAPNGWGCGYVYGFRVPLLVVSAYTPPRTISGPTGVVRTSYPPPKEWTHDFGSILKFTENNFLGPNAAIAPQTPIKYTYADQNSLDAVYQGQAVVPLWEFFLGSYRAFTPISPTSSSYGANYFMNYYQTPQNGALPTPTGPDGGDDD